jgi:hypothetical protein
MEEQTRSWGTGRGGGGGRDGEDEGVEAGMDGKIAFSRANMSAMWCSVVSGGMSPMQLYSRRYR